MYPQDYKIPVFILIHRKRKQPFKAVTWVRTLQSVATPTPLDVGSSRVVRPYKHRTNILVLFFQTILEVVLSNIVFIFYF